MNDFLNMIHWQDAAFVLGFIALIYKIGKYKHNFETLGSSQTQMHIEMNKRFEQMHTEMDKRFMQVDARFMQVDAKFEQLDAKMDKKFEQMDAKIEHLRTEFTQRFDSLRNEFNQNLHANRAELLQRISGLDNKIENIAHLISTLTTEISLVSKGLVLVEKDIQFINYIEKMTKQSKAA